jgi:uncharacterized membrane protein
MTPPPTPPLLTLEHLYWLVGAMFAAFALLSLFDRTSKKAWGNAAFWGLMAASLIGGSYFGDFVNGLIVLGLVGLAGLGFTGRSQPKTTSRAERKAFADLRGNWLFMPALIVPLVVLVGTLAFYLTPFGEMNLFTPRRETYFFLAAGVLVALLVAQVWLRPPLLAPLQEGRRLIDAIGWAAVLPQLLLAMGKVFDKAGVSGLIQEGTLAMLPPGNLFLAVLVFALGMAMFTIITGNAFAAFPVMASAIAIPLLINTYHGDPAVIGAIGMLAGFCGTLMTPLAANFNIVPVRLLELQDPNAVVKAQFATALPMFAVNVALIYFLAFRA